MFRRYLAIWVTTLVIPLTGLAVANMIVDPHDRGFALASSRYEPLRNRLSNRTSKANRLAAGRWRVLVVGSSREELGFNPSSDAWREWGATFNAGLPGSNLFESRRVIEFALEHQPIERVVLGLGLVMFGAERGAVDDFSRSRFAPQPWESTVESWFRSLCGWDASRSTWRLWTAGPETQLIETREDGFRPGPETLSHPRDLSAELLRYYFTSRDAYAGYRFSKQRVADLQAIAERCVEGEVRLYLVIPPMHAWQLIAIEAAGLWDSWERLKRELVEVAEPAGKVREGIEVWDLSGFTGMVAEPIPPRSSDRRMRHYYEISHFRPSLGDRVIETIRDGVARADGELPAVRLRRMELDAHLADQRAARDRYRSENPSDVEWITRLRDESPCDRSAPPGGNR